MSKKPCRCYLCPREFKNDDEKFPFTFVYETGILAQEAVEMQLDLCSECKDWAMEHFNILEAILVGRYKKAMGEW